MFSLRELRVGILGVVLVDELREAQGASHAGRTAADDDDVGLHLGAVDAFEGFAENQHFAAALGQNLLATDFRGPTRIARLVIVVGQSRFVVRLELRFCVSVS